jgi:RNA polymerase primary sigma factor
MYKKSVYPIALKIYLKQIHKTSVLSRDEEKVCAKCASEGDKEAEKKLVTSNLRFVVSMAMKYRSFGIPLLDLINEGNIGLIRAAKKYNLQKGVKFISYARWWVRHFMLKAIFEQSCSTKFPFKYPLKMLNREENEATRTDNECQNMYNTFSMDKTVFSHDGSATFMDYIEAETYDSPEKTFMNTHLKETINKSIKNLKTREQDIIIRHFGLNGKTQLPLREIGHMYNVTKARIQQIEKAALNKLKYTLVKKKVKDFER